MRDQLLILWVFAETLGKRTSNFVVDFDKMKGLTANGATVGFAGPCFQTGIMKNMTANLYDSDIVFAVMRGLVAGGDFSSG